ncbi:tRNA (adenosine(37)-N6)-dimethylallyltransferase MiaA [Acaricomes phytoseiuli]|uniref:tRNA (adenosine(37)-N6)-dimethylallyltransferase MiaA n=1 Tax=Acaricomes phytoseiuli TaxID=291968 RepID=UPI0003611114|nr:tRNA (adenosine(37)-N6)-dimethylallyltransferase MiaA [Acaricomes phytoseiuli]MCW1248815.1 tRNA (adenosine(37)-N6)-dimethylallyltransferase MiaA [Acaricomes phytoseiuli]
MNYAPGCDAQTLPVIAVVGATGTGKSELGLRLAEELGGEIINADSMQFYRGMDIGTAKLSLVERRGISHHLLDILEVREEASVAAFQEQARQAIETIRARGRLPILVGGSGLYLRAVLDVLELPPTDPLIRARWEAELSVQGLPALRERLRAVDPKSAQRLGDARRVVRALEVHELTGRPFSAYLPRREYYQPAVQIGLDGSREHLHRRLAERVHRMAAAGLLQEVSALADHGLREGKTAPHALGYRQFLRVLDEGPEQYSEETAIADTVIATRQFARRQITWFTADSRVRWLDFDDPEHSAQALHEVRQFLSARP